MYFVIYITYNTKQDRQCTHNVTLRRVHENIFAVEKQKSITYLCVCASLRLFACMWLPERVDVCMSICAYSLANPACNAYAPYCDVNCGFSVSTIFSDIIS
jgi:hypothetical protein